MVTTTVIDSFPFWTGGNKNKGRLSLFLYMESVDLKHDFFRAAHISYIKP